MAADWLAAVMPANPNNISSSHVRRSLFTNMDFYTGFFLVTPSLVF